LQWATPFSLFATPQSLKTGQTGGCRIQKHRPVPIHCKQHAYLTIAGVWQALQPSCEIQANPVTLHSR